MSKDSEALYEGSSPRVRGTLGELAGDACHKGIIPACAGNTGELLTRLAALGDHPRVCGEHTSLI